jgi:hypothetical protein
VYKQNPADTPLASAPTAHLPLLCKVFTGRAWPVKLILAVSWPRCWHAAAQHVLYHGLLLLVLLVLLVEAEVVVLWGRCSGCCYPAPAWLLLLVLAVAVAAQQHRAWA